MCKTYKMTDCSDRQIRKVNFMYAASTCFKQYAMGRCDKTNEILIMDGVGIFF